jgi:hypothetical protein
MRHEINALAEYVEGGATLGRDGAAISCTEPLVLLAKFTDGLATPFEVEWLRDGFAAFLSMEGAVPLERCLRLPTTIASWRRARRDSWLMKAAAVIDADDSATGSLKLQKEWNIFLSRGPWLAWKEEAGPPPNTVALQEALFWASRLSRSKSLGAKQIERIAGHVFKKKCR